jgi:hypothetical protein
MKTNEILTPLGISELKNYWADKFLTASDDLDLSNFANDFAVTYGAFFSEMYQVNFGELESRPPYVDSPLDLKAFFETLKNFQINTSSLITTTEICDPDCGALESTVLCLEAKDFDAWKMDCRNKCTVRPPQVSLSFMAFCPNTSSYWRLLRSENVTEFEGAVDMDHMSYMDLFLTHICPDMSEEDIQNQYFLISE